MKEGNFAQNKQELQPLFRDRFYKRLSSFCYRKLKQNYLTVSHKFVFLFLLSLCAEITLYLNAPVFRSVRINFPQAIVLNTTDYNVKPPFFQQNPDYKNSALFLRILHPSMPVSAQMHNPVVPISLQIIVFIIFIPLTKRLIRDDRIIVDTKIKLSPITAQGPPFIEYCSTIEASRIRTPYLCRKKTNLFLQAEPNSSVLTKNNYSNYQNLYLYFSDDPLASRASRSGEIFFNPSQKSREFL